MRITYQNNRRFYLSLHELIRIVDTNYIYDKHEDDVHFLVSKINMDNCFAVMSPIYVQSFNRIVMHLLNTL